MSSAADDTRHLARQVEDLRSQQRALSGVLRAMARAEGLQPVLDEVLEAAKRLCDGEHAQLYMVEGDVLVIFATDRSAEPAYEYSVQHPHAKDRTTVTGRVALTGQTVQIPDVLDDAEYSHGAQQLVRYRALLGVPILLDEELIGVINVVATVLASSPITT